MNVALSKLQIGQIKRDYSRKVITIYDIVKNYNVTISDAYKLVDSQKKRQRPLSNEQIEKIRNEVANSDRTLVSIASDYSYSPSAISHIARGVTYRDAPGPITNGRRHRNPKRVRSNRYSDEDVQMMRLLFWVENKTASEIAEMFPQNGKCIKKGSVYNIVYGTRYKYVPTRNSPDWDKIVNNYLGNKTQALARAS
jgi:hypothetical protein